MRLTRKEITRLSADERPALTAALWWDRLDDDQISLTAAQQVDRHQATLKSVFSVGGWVNAKRHPALLLREQQQHPVDEQEVGQVDGAIDTDHVAQPSEPWDGHQSEWALEGYLVSRYTAQLGGCESS